MGSETMGLVGDNPTATTLKLVRLFEELIPTPEDKTIQVSFLQRLDYIMTTNWKEAKLFLYGSCANTFGVRNSDIDVCLAVTDPESTKADLILRLAKILREAGMRNVQALTHARVPIVKFSDSDSKVACDICANNLLAVANTRLLQNYSRIDNRLRPLAFLVKHWAKRRQVNETYRGTLSSYAYVIMCIHFLQQRRPPLLPCLQEMEATYATRVGPVFCGYYDKIDLLQDFGKENKEGIEELLLGFFDYWAFRHDYNRAVISIRTGGFITKDEKEWTRRVGNERHLLCIEDPFEVTHDLGRVVDRHSIRVLRDEFQRAAKILRLEPDPCATLFEPYIRDPMY